MFWSKKKEPEPEILDKDIPGTYEWCKKEKEEYGFETWSEYFLLRSPGNWPEIITWKAAVRIWMHLMEEQAKKNLEK